MEVLLDEPVSPVRPSELTGHTTVVLPTLADTRLRAAALLAAHVHRQGEPVTGASDAAALLQRFTEPRDPRRFQAWLLQGLYHRLAGVEARRTARGEALARAHDLRALSVLRLAATTRDAGVRQRARLVLAQVPAAAVRGSSQTRQSRLLSA